MVPRLSMPRLIPRLLRHLETARARPPSTAPLHTPPRRKQQEHDVDPLPQLPSLSPEGRAQSIVLDSLEPIMTIARHKRHKALPPVVKIPQPRNKGDQPVLYVRGEPRRAMSTEERALWANPYLRMLSTPIRQCMLTKRLLPKAFLIRLAPKLLAPTRIGGNRAEILAPDGLEHPNFKSPRLGNGYHITCFKDAITMMVERGVHKRVGRNVTVHKYLQEQIAHMLRVRVLQEMHILSLSLQRGERGALDAPIIRRLTRAEWKGVKSSGAIPYANAVAVLVVPPVNTSPSTKKRPKPNISTAPTPDFVDGSSKGSRSLPLCVMHPTSSDPLDALIAEDEDLPRLLPQSRVPLYNGITLCPDVSQRAALHTSLLHLLRLERVARFKQHALLHRMEEARAQAPGSANEEPEKKPGQEDILPGDEKGSHAFLLCSDESTLLRADVAPLAMALWRVRMFEGGGWDEKLLETSGGWASSA
ncbi:hypothetical protein BKA93DRAFT_850097 [Sparassis latifolia]